MEKCPICNKTVEKLAVFHIPGQPLELMCDDCAEAKALDYWVKRGADGVKIRSKQGTKIVKPRKKWWEWWKK